MHQQSIGFFRCPATGAGLRAVDCAAGDSGAIAAGRLVSEFGSAYTVTDGIPDFTIATERDKNDYAIALFGQKAKDYDTYQHLSFETFYENETAVRNGMIDKLRLASDACVLEVNAGTGRDSVLIAERLSSKGVLHVQDISRAMLEICAQKVLRAEPMVEIHQGNACRLPYADNVFDAVYSFGGVGMNTYSNNREAIAEMVRVAKPGGRIVFGGLSLAPWLRRTYFGNVLINHNTHYANEITLSDLPVEARELNLSWILGGAGFVIDFTVGEGEPKANFDYEIPGVRGGTLRTRYEGKLEGVTPEAKELAQRAIGKLGISMHQWLDAMIKKEAASIINE